MFRWLKQKFSSQAPGAVEPPPMALERHAGDGAAPVSIASLQADNDLTGWLARGREGSWVNPLNPITLTAASAGRAVCKPALCDCTSIAKEAGRKPALLRASS